MAWASFNDREQVNASGFDSKAEKYVRPDLEGWLSASNVRKKAEKQGKANQPMSDASSLDDTESQIVDWVNSRGRTCREDVVRHLSDLERELAHLDDEQELVALGQEVQETKRNTELDLERKVRDGKNLLAVPEKEIFNLRTDFEAFRKEAGLTRLPDDSHRSNALAVIFSCLLIEAALNASLLMDVIPTGLLGAIGQMILISGVNVFILGFPAGELLRHTHHWQRSRVVICSVLFGSFALIAAVFNLTVGHFRDSIQAVLI